MWSACNINVNEACKRLSMWSLIEYKALTQKQKHYTKISPAYLVYVWCDISLFIMALARLKNFL